MDTEFREYLRAVAREALAEANDNGSVETLVDDVAGSIRYRITDRARASAPEYGPSLGYDRRVRAKAASVVADAEVAEAVAGCEDLPWLSRRPTKVKDAAFVYFVTAGDLPYVKIGKAKRPNERVAELQTGNPLPLAILGVIPVRASHAYVAEVSLHRRFDGDRVRPSGEWFHLSEAVRSFMTAHTVAWRP